MEDGSGLRVVLHRLAKLLTLRRGCLRNFHTIRMNKIRLSPAGPLQIPLVQEIARKTWPSTFGAILSREQLAYMMERMYSNASLTQQMAAGHRFLLAYERETACGFTSFEVNYQQTAILKIHKLYILPEAQGKGVGKRILEKLERIAQEESQNALELNVNKYNQLAIDFYFKRGFVTVKEEVIPIGEGFVMDDFCLKKALPAG